MRCSMVTTIKSNWKSGLTVALVSIPLSISLAVASGVTPEQGIITAIWAGLVASLCGGSHYNIIGPTGALSGLIASFVLTNGIASVSMLAIIVGCMILIAYALRVDRYLIFIPSSVIHGFTLGVACIIALNQLNFILGLHDLPAHAEFIENIRESFVHLKELSVPTLIVFIIFFVALQLLHKFARAIPGAILIAPLGILLGYVGDWLHLETLASRYGQISSQLVQLPSLAFATNLIWPAGIVALIAILETMLSAKTADGLTKTRHASGKELLGLGLANIASGLAGGIPATAALARTALNIKAGATNRMSATISSIMMIVISFICLAYFSYMPMAVIAAILVNVAWGMIETEQFGRLYTHDKVNFGISVAVACITLYKDPIVGILGGAMISLLFFVEKLSHGYYDIEVKHEKAVDAQLAASAQKAGILLYTFRGKLTYINCQAHLVRFETGFAQPYTTMILNLQNVNFIDIDGIDAFDEIVDILHKQNKKVMIAGAHPPIKSLLSALSAEFVTLQNRASVFETTADALDALELTNSKSIHT